MKTKQYHKATGLILLGLLLLFGCKRDQLQPAPPSLLSTYHGTDKMVLQVIDQLQQPANRAILAELEKQGSINWQYKALFSSRFIKGYTLRFALGSSGNYLDAEIDAKTGEIKLFTKEMQLSKDQQVRQHLQNTRLKQGNGTLNDECVFFVFFEIHNIDNFSPDLWESIIKILLCDYLAVVGGNLYVQEVYVESSNYLIIVAPSGTTAEQVEMDLRPDNHPLGVYMDVESISVIGGCGDENGTVIQDIPPITWRPTTVISTETGKSQTLPSDPIINATPFKTGGFWKIKINFITVAVRMIIRTGSFRDPYYDPPQSAYEANEAINEMSDYFSRGGIYENGWSTVDATKAHENYHFTEIKAIYEHYWPQMAACLNSVQLPVSGNDEADKALAETRVKQIAGSLKGFYIEYQKTLSDGAGGRPYAAGQLELNKAITMVKQRANANGWWTTGGPTIPNVDISNPTYQPFIPFNCPF